MIEIKRGLFSGGSEKRSACSVLGIREGFMVMLQLGELCQGEGLNLRQELAFLPGNGVSERGSVGSRAMQEHLVLGNCFAR